MSQTELLLIVKYVYCTYIHNKHISLKRNTHFIMIKLRRPEGGAAISVCASQQEGPGFDTRA